MKLSILIPSRNEMFLKQTIDDALKNIEADTEIIAVLDGQWADPPIPQNERVNIIYLPESIGQRAAQNLACRLSKAKYVMKVDAHCSFDRGFDRKMLEGFEKTGDNVTMVPIMRNLWAFDWKCYHCGWKKYQGPTPLKCEACGKTDKIRRKMLWIGKQRPQSTSYCFDSEPHFQYANEYTKRPGYSKGIIVGYDLSFDSQGPSFGIISLLTDLTNSHQLTCSRNCFWQGQNMTPDTMSFSSINNSGGIRTNEISRIGNKLEMGRVTTPSISTDVVNDGNVLSSATGNTTNKPSISDTMCECFLSEMSTPSISASIKSPLPIPTTGDTINSDVINKFIDVLGGQFVYSEKTSSFHNGSVSLKPIYDKGFTETMSLQGSCFMSTRENYWKWDVCDEKAGSWGNQGLEVACATWLNGGRVLVNHSTWYAHMFRTQGGDFGFPYHQGGREVSKTKNYIKEKYFKPGLKDLIKKFWPVPGWSEEDLNDLYSR